MLCNACVRSGFRHLAIRLASSVIQIIRLYLPGGALRFALGKSFAIFFSKFGQSQRENFEKFGSLSALLIYAQQLQVSKSFAFYPANRICIREQRIHRA